jgi:hypothetical protein
MRGITKPAPNPISELMAENLRMTRRLRIFLMPVDLNSILSLKFLSRERRATGEMNATMAKMKKAEECTPLESKPVIA